MNLYTCERCGANLDPGEKCDCNEKVQPAEAEPDQTKKDTNIITRKEHKMELKIIKPTGEDFIKAIEWNHEEILKEITEKVSIYKSLVYTDDQIKEAKADRAELNKFKKNLEDKRKEIKAQCLAPYETFEKQMKEITAVIDEPIQIIDQQVKAYEEKQKTEKEETIKAYCEEADLHGFTYDQIKDPKWLNAGTSLKSIYEAIDKKAADISADIKLLETLEEYSFEALEEYRLTLDVRSALAEAQRLKELAEQKRLYEAQRQAELEAAQQAAQQTEPEPIEPEPAEPEEPEEFIPDFEDNFVPDFTEIKSEREMVALKANITPEDRKALIDFFQSRSIEFYFL